MLPLRGLPEAPLTVPVIVPKYTSVILEEGKGELSLPVARVAETLEVK